MRAGGQKAKGNAAEIAVAKLLSSWLTHGQRQDVLERSPASGAKFTSHQKRQRDFGNIAGDLIAVAEEGNRLISRFVIEVKHRNEEGININGLVFRTSESGVIAFWKKLLLECKQTQKLPMLIFKQNNRPLLLGLCKEGVELFEYQKHNHAVFKIGSKSMYLSPFMEFLVKANPDVLLKIVDKHEMHR